ncbi:MAG: phosphatidylserine decarboxylase [Bdellovibrionales bacterium]|jgi:phosphatidylserine decarboxylase|nr:phosphatidylserine decarboxylase [Bdellovibrionales bacterium]
MKSFLDRRIHLAFLSLLVICYIASWTGLFFFTVIFYVLSYFYFRQRDIEYNSDSDLTNRVVSAPVSGKVINIEQSKSTEDFRQEMSCLVVRVGPLNDFGIFSPINAEVKDVDKRVGLAHFRYRKNESTDASAMRLILEDKQNIKLVIEFVQCTLGLLPQFKVLAGDFVKLGANIGYFPFGGIVKVYIPKGVKIMIRPGEEVVSGETILGGFEQLDNNNE